MEILHLGVPIPFYSKHFLNFTYVLKLSHISIIKKCVWIHGICYIDTLSVQWEHNLIFNNQNESSWQIIVF